MQYKGSVALITGASSGIGRATAVALAKEGVCLALAARNIAALNQLAVECRQYGVEAEAFGVDVSIPEEVAGMGKAVFDRFGRVDILVANAGKYVRCPVVETSQETLAEAMAINFYGSTNAVQEVLPGMLTRRSGHIVLVSSLDGRKGLPGDAPYAASKGALTCYGEVLRQELYKTGVSVTIISPGRVDTPLIDHLRVPAISPKIPPEAVARAILRSIRSRQPEVVIPWTGWVYYFTNVLSPGLTDWAVRKLHLEGWEQ